MLHDFHQTLFEHVSFLGSMIKALFQLSGFKLMPGGKLCKPCLFALQHSTTLKHQRNSFLQLFKHGALHGNNPNTNNELLPTNIKF